MLKHPLLLTGLLACIGTQAAVHTTESDTSRVINLEEAIVVATPKQTTQLRKQSLSANIYSGKELEQLQVTSLKGLSALTPNFFMPDYGSRYTSAVYIRGIGSRMNTPAVGLYVDNIAYVDKSAYDFSFTDIERVDVLRGPQATLYGRNTMGGVIRVYTSDPLRNYGTQLSLGGSTRNGGRSASFTTFLHPSDNFGISLTGYYNGEAGFFKNATTGKHADFSDAGGGKLRMSYRPSSRLRFDFTASYEQSYEGACPYFYEGAAAGAELYPDYLGTLSQNRPSTYRRSVLNTGLSIAWRAEDFTLNSVTAYQRVADRLFIDQDFIAADIFSLDQRQKLNTISQEFSLKSKGGKPWQWTTGVYGMYQHAKTTCPVDFYQDGVDYLNNIFKNVLPAGMPMSLGFTGSELPFRASLKTPAANAALFHQSSYKFDNGLTLSAGLRLDYDYQRLDLRSGVATPIDFQFAMMGRPTPFQSNPVLNDKLNNDTWQLLPKLALQYDFKQNLGNVYASVSKGYRSGGYNIQAYSDLSQSMLQGDMMQQVYDYSYNMMTSMGMPGAVVERNLSSLKENIPAPANAQSLYYKPEQTWSYEVGSHFNFCEGAFQLDATAFWMDTRDQQVANFAESGMGRNVKNAGKSRSYGAELSARTRWMDNRLTVNTNYGFTHATFRSTDNYVPYVPKHTLSATADFRQPLNNDVLRAVTVGANVFAAGDIQWDEANTHHQDFYATLGAHLSLEFARDIQFTLWGKNLTDTNYDTFRFDSMNRRYAQRGIPCHFGAELKVKF